LRRLPRNRAGAKKSSINAETLLAYGDENDITAYPLWAIVERTTVRSLDGIERGSEVIWRAGPWFSRAAADAHLKAKAHNFPDCFVYCFSGHASIQYRKIVDAARAELGVEAP
jgi:hypothetical protein